MSTFHLVIDKNLIKMQKLFLSVSYCRVNQKLQELNEQQIKIMKIVFAQHICYHIACLHTLESETVYHKQLERFLLLPCSILIVGG